DPGINRNQGAGRRGHHLIRILMDAAPELAALAKPVYVLVLASQLELLLLLHLQLLLLLLLLLESPSASRWIARSISLRCSNSCHHSRPMQSSRCRSRLPYDRTDRWAHWWCWWLSNCPCQDCNSCRCSFC